jgi:hypothetical protein
MLIIQYNCRKTYIITITTLKTGFALNAAIIYLQKPYIKLKNYILYLNYILYWLKKENLKNKKIITVIKRDFIIKIIIEV